MKLGEKLKKLRITKNLTQLEVAKSLNLTKEEISNFEEGINNPDEATMKAFADFYKIEEERLENDYMNLYEVKKGTKNIIMFLILSMVTIFNVLLVLLLLFFLADRVITGVDENAPHRYVNKYYTLLFLFPFVGFYVVSLFMRLNNKENYRAIFITDSIDLALELAVGTIAIIFYYINIKDIQEISQNLFYSIIGIIFFILGFSVHPLINRPKAILGYRSSLTLGNDEAWYKVNTFLSYSVIIFSVIFIIVNLFVKNYYFIFFMLIPFVLTVLYHEYLKLKVKKHNANFLEY